MELNFDKSTTILMDMSIKLGGFLLTEKIPLDIKEKEDLLNLASMPSLPDWVKEYSMAIIYLREKVNKESEEFFTNNFNLIN